MKTKQYKSILFLLISYSTLILFNSYYLSITANILCVREDKRNPWIVKEIEKSIYSIFVESIILFINYPFDNNFYLSVGSDFIY